MMTWTIVTAVATFAMAIATFGIAIYTSRAATATRDTSRGQLLLALLSEYGSDEMALAATELSSWLSSDAKSKASMPSLVTAQRRRYSQYHQKIHALHESGLIDEKIVKQAVLKDQASLYLAIEPLEARIRSYDQSSFRFFAQLYGLQRDTTPIES